MTGEGSGLPICYTFRKYALITSPSSTWSSPVQPPSIKTHPKPIQRLIHRLRTPQQVQRWLLKLQYNKKDTMHTIHGVMQRRQAHCLKAALTATAILEHHGPAPHRRSSATTGAGYPPLILDLDSTDDLGHTLFLYRQAGRYGTIGFSRDVGLNGRRPVYKTIRALVQSYAAPYIDAQARITSYGVLDLRSLRNEPWRHSARQTWFVEKKLIHMPHRQFKSSPLFLRTWRRRYLEFRKQHPGKQPTFYPHQQHWI